MEQRRLFISHSSQDREAARKIGELIDRMGCTSWLSGSIPAHDDSWPALAGRAISDNDALILLWSRAAADSASVEFECSTAKSLNKPIIACALDDTPLNAGLIPMERLGVGELGDSLPGLVARIPGSGRGPDEATETALLDSIASRDGGPGAPEATIVTSSPGISRTESDKSDSPETFASTGEPMAPTSASLTAGAHIGARYTVKRRLGQGGMGAVYLVLDSELDRDVALKVIRQEIAGNPEILERFKREIQLSSVVTHKNVLRVYDLGESGGIKFLTMQYVEGENLSALLRRERIPCARVVNIFRQICEALQAAHEQGVLHRDLKPDNVMVDQNGRVYLTDFGLAKSLQQSALTHAGQIMGTPDYMSPEQVKGEPVDERSDIYSLGALLYQMLAGEVPFHGNSIFEVMIQRVQNPPRPVKELNPDVPPFLAEITERCMAIDTEARYSSVDGILQDLDRGAATGETCAETRLQLGEIRKGPGKKSRRGALAAVAGLLLVVALAAIYFLMLPTGTRAPENAVLPDRKYVAVLPFRVLGDKEQLGYLGTGLSEAISAKLFQLRELQVASTSAVEGVEANTPLQSVARQLGVSLIVHGTIQGSGERIAVTVKLDDMESGKSLWAKSYSGLIPDLLTLEDQIYGELLNQLHVNPSVEERSRAVTHYTEDTEAYDLYLRGRNALRSRQNVGSVQQALGFFQEALKQDSNFALAYVGLADGSLAMYDETKGGDWAQRAVAAGEQAQRLNQDLPEVYFTLGSVYRTIGRQAEAIAVLNRAIELAPNSDEGYRRLGAALVGAGRTPEALAAYQKAVELNPYYWLNYSALGGAHFEIGEYDEALEAYRKVTELEPENVWGYLNIGAVRFSQGKYEEAIPAFEKALAIEPSWDTYSNLGTAYFFLGRYEDSVHAFEKAYELNPNQHVVAGNLADAYRWSGRKDKAQVLYDRAIKLAYTDLDVNPRDAKTLSFLALYFSKKGDSTKAADLMRRARTLDPDNVEFLYHETVVNLLGGDKAGALNSLEEAISKGYPVEAVERDPELATLRELPQYEAIRSAAESKEPASNASTVP